MERTIVRSCGLLLSLLVMVASCQRFDFPSPPTRSPGLQEDGAGNLYTAAGNQLFRLNSSNLEQKETRQLSSEAVNISLSSNGRWLIVCLTDRSCEVYNATNFSTGHIFRRENAITSTENIALFAAEDSFYVGEIAVNVNTGTQQQIILRQYGFAGRRNGTTTSGTYDVTRGEFERNFYGGFVRGNNTYFFVVDNNPSTPSGVRNVRVMRVCHNSDFKALYELTLGCGPRTPASDTRISGMSVVEDFGGLSGLVVILSRNRPGSSHNYVCLLRLEEIDSEMQAKYDSCTASSSSTQERIELSWRDSADSCNTFTPTGDVCRFVNNPSLALDDFDSEGLDRNDLRVNLGQLPLGRLVNNFITASVAVVMDSFSLVYIAYTDPNGDFFILGFDVSTSRQRNADDGFDIRPISDGPVSQLEWRQRADFIYAVTNSSIIQVPIADCASRSNCSSCLGNGNPLCGWCIVENKCSKQNECQNPDTRWIRANRNTNQCPDISISPSQFDLSESQTVLTLTVSQSLPPLLMGETYLCHFASGRVTFTVDAVGNETMYTCNVTGMIPSEYSGFSTVIHVSLASSFLQIPFSTNLSALTIFQCDAASSCSQCLQTNNVCGWCVYNKVCSGTPAPCVNGTENFLQLSISEDFTDVCPLLYRPPGRENYLQPVQAKRNIELVTRNLPAEISGFTYTCSVNGINLSVVYNNESSLTCIVNANQLTLPGGIAQREVTVSILWVGRNSQGRNISHTIDSLMPTNVLLYSCPDLTDGCSSCLGLSLENGFECGWCDRSTRMTDTCSFTGDCSADLVTSSSQCPDPTVTAITPSSGPPEGGTTITITGRELGVTFDDFTADSITIGADQNSVPCTPTDRESFIPGRRIRCITTGGGTVGSKTIKISISSRFGTSNVQFQVVTPQIVGVVPSRGPQAGGTRLTVNGTDLNIGNIEDTRIAVAGGTECTVDPGTIQATSITCTTSAFNGSSPVTGEVVVMIDNANITNSSVQYMYTPNPEFYSVTPSNTILGGGIELIFTGANLDVVVSPMLVVTDPQYLDVTNSTQCTILNSTAISCITPPLNRIQPGGDTDGVNYTIRVDDAPGPDITNVSLQISVLPNPRNFMLIDTEYNINSGTVIRIMGENLDSMMSGIINVTVGGEICKITSVTGREINCEPPQEPPGGDTESTVTVTIGLYLSERLRTPLSYIITTTTNIPLEIIIPVVVGGLLIVVALSMLIICCVVCYHNRKSKKNEQRWTNLLSQMELMEMEMADECKRAFTELQTDLADLVQISDANLPYRDFRSFAMRFLFPQAGSDHPILLPLQLPEKTEQDEVINHLKSFQSLIMDKKFLLVFIHTLEGQGGRFTLQDKCTVASLLMVAFQNDLDYATEVLQTLLSELMRKSLNNKSHPKLLLRRTESVAEKMLANWLAFLLFPYLLDHVGQPLFTLYRAIKSQLEKGPVDIITGEARHSLSEEKLLRQHIEVRSVEGLVEPENGEDIPIKMLDCDSITQAKEKVLDALYKNCPASKRPQLTEVDLILQSGTASFTLRDQDHTNKREGDWTKINTLGSYNVDEMSQRHLNNDRLPIPRFKLQKRPERGPENGEPSFDTLGTIIANVGAESRGNMMTSGEYSHVFHLVRTDPDEGDDVEKRGGKIMSEVFLTRLLSTKRILQPYVDAVFESIFATTQGRTLPKAIKSLFDFLDLQASELGIQDPEILHTWKTNSVPLRFWVNVIKNPDFVFDIHKSATVDSCLTVIAQAYIDACSTAELKYSKDTPSARLLYVNEVKKYKQDVQQFYSYVQSQPKLSQYEMGEYLRTTAQVCASSVEQVEPDLPSNDLAPASMTRRLYFIQESALHELFKFASQYSEEIIDGLNEEGLSRMATNFQQLKSSIPV